MSRLTQYLYVNEQLRVSVLLSEEGAGSTITARVCESDAGTPSAIGSLTATATTTSGTPAAYTLTFSAASLQSALATYVGRRVYLHVSSSANGWYEVYPYLVTDRDPDLLAPLLS
jgi:hypothetical protein